MSLNTTRRAVLGLSAALLSCSVAFPSLAQNTNPIRIAAIHPYSGPMANYGDESARGAELAVEWINAQGGLLGRTVELVRGDATNAQQGIAVVDQLAGDVDIFTGTYTSAVSNAASDAAARHNKIYWDTMALAQNLTDRGLPNFIRSGPDASTFGTGSVKTVVELVAPALGKDPSELTVWIEHESSIYGTSIADTQERLFADAGIEVVGRGTHPYDAIDLGDSVLRARNANPDVWIQTGYTNDSNLLLRTARDQGFSPSATVLVGTGASPETLDALGAESLEGVLVVVYPRADVKDSFGPGATEFLQAYRDKYGRDPIASESMTSFVGMQMLFETVKAAGDTSVEAIRNAAAEMDKPLYSYATGFGMKFDDKFQNTRAPTVTVQWQDGAPVTVFPEEAAMDGVELVPFNQN